MREGQGENRRWADGDDGCRPEGFTVEVRGLKGPCPVAEAVL